MPTGSQDKQFAEKMRDNSEVSVGSNALDEAIEWIAENIAPEDVFHHTKLEAWAESNGYVKE
jgi:hypothetical protein